MNKKLMAVLGALSLMACGGSGKAWEGDAPDLGGGTPTTGGTWGDSGGSGPIPAARSVAVGGTAAGGDDAGVGGTAVGTGGYEAGGSYAAGGTGVGAGGYEAGGGYGVAGTAAGGYEAGELSVEVVGTSFRVERQTELTPARPRRRARLRPRPHRLRRRRSRNNYLRRVRGAVCRRQSKVLETLPRSPVGGRGVLS